MEKFTTEDLREEKLTGNEFVMDAARLMFKAYDADGDGRVNLEGTASVCGILLHHDTSHCIYVL